METTKRIISKRHIFEVFVVFFCAIIATSIVYVLMHDYKPSQNSLVALSTVSMDVISMIILIILMMNIIFEKGQLSRTTRLFTLLLLFSMFALFFDFLTWSYDGALSFHNITFMFILTSLCMGAILAGVFTVYISSYMADMYDMKIAATSPLICVIANIIAFVITLILGATGEAFVIENGHYMTGPLYDIVTVIPVLTLLYMTGYAFFNIKIIGMHDVNAIAGYIMIMICGAFVEAAYGIGTTYVSVTAADIFIFVMLQNKLIDRVRQQRESLFEKATNQLDILNSMAGIYSYINYVDLAGKEVRRFDIDESVSEEIDFGESTHTSLNCRLYDDIADESKKKFWEYTDLSTLSNRMGDEKIISAEFLHNKDGWIRAHYIRIGDQTDGPIEKVIYAIRNINEEKKNVEKWIRKSNTDELTGFYNRHAYEDEIAELKLNGIPDNFVYVSVDVNGLKLTNDTLGHDAGDELIIGACDCMKKCMGAYGKLFRTGGDEFAALLYVSNIELDLIKRNIEEVTSKWSGRINQQLTLSCGFVTKEEAAELSLHQIAVLADQRMYEDKTQYYQKKGIDRRGQKDAHVALHTLYTKILKVNITDDTYQIVDMDSDERDENKGFTDTISNWLRDFGTTGQVHPEDLDDYLASTDLAYMRNYFKDQDESLKIFYRRKYPNGYRNVMMEIIRANDYTNDNQTLFLYVKSM